jgi:hypothetical protein
MGSIRGKNQRSKISCYCPFKVTSENVNEPGLEPTYVECTRMLYWRKSGRITRVRVTFKFNPKYFPVSRSGVFKPTVV